MMILIQEEQIREIASDVWSGFLGMDLVACGDEQFSEGGDCMKATVVVTGDWNGEVTVECYAPLAAEAASRMFEVKPDELSNSELLDALGEIVNMVGGNIKGLLPGANKLSLPCVSHGVCTIPVPCERSVNAVFRFENERLSVRVAKWEESES